MHFLLHLLRWSEFTVDIKLVSTDARNLPVPHFTSSRLARQERTGYVFRSSLFRNLARAVLAGDLTVGRPCTKSSVLYRYCRIVIIIPYQFWISPTEHRSALFIAIQTNSMERVLGKSHSSPPVLEPCSLNWTLFWDIIMHPTPSNSTYVIFILILSFQVVSFIPVQRLNFCVHFSSQTLDTDENTNYLAFFSGKKVVKPRCCQVA